jgi:hypothetical protein
MTELDQAPKKKAGADKMVMLEIHKVEGDSGSTHVPVAVNGKTWLIKRGERVEVPAFIAEVLQNAIKDVFLFDDQTKSIVKKEMPSYPFSSNAI